MLNETVVFVPPDAVKPIAVKLAPAKGAQEVITTDVRGNPGGLFCMASETLSKETHVAPTTTRPWKVCELERLRSTHDPDGRKVTPGLTLMPDGGGEEIALTTTTAEIRKSASGTTHALPLIPVDRIATRPPVVERSWGHSMRQRMVLGC